MLKNMAILEDTSKIAGCIRSPASKIARRNGDSIQKAIKEEIVEVFEDYDMSHKTVESMVDMIKNRKDEDGDDQNFRDKDRELKEAVKSKLSMESQDVIELNNEEFDRIIESLRKKGVSRDKGIELQKLRTISRGNRTLGH